MVFEIITLIANVVLSSVAIIIAIWSSHRTSKDATRQVESIKQLAKIQIETTLRQIEVEIQKNRLLAKQAYAEWQEMKELQNSQLGADFRNHRKRKIEEERPRKQMEFYDTYIQSLNEISGKLTKLEVKLNK